MSERCLKILLIGDSFVGKTSLLIRYCDGEFYQNHMATIGVEFKEKKLELDGRSIKLQIWDTSGQERFRSITQNFYRNADGILFVFDVTKKTTFDHIKDWLLDSQVENSDIKRILIGNKIDLVDARVIDQKKMENFGAIKNMKCFEASAKMGTNVDNIFLELVKLILENKTEEEINELYTKNQQNLSISTDSSNESKKKKKKCC